MDGSSIICVHCVHYRCQDLVRKGKQRFDEFDYNRCIMGRFIYIYSNVPPSL